MPASTAVVVHVTNCFFPLVGGISTNVSGLARASEKHLGVLTSVIAYPPHVDHWRRKLRWRPLGRGLHTLACGWTILRTLGRTLWHTTIGHRVIVHSHSAGFCLVAAALSKYSGATAIHTVHTAAASDQTPESWALRVYRWSARRVDHVVFCCEFLKRQQEVWLAPTSSQVVYFGAANAGGLNKAGRKTIRASLGIPEHEFLLLWVGNLEPWKDPLLAIAAIALVPSVHLVIIGDGTLRSEIERHVHECNLESRVHLVGALPHEVAMSWMAEADALLLTSRQEGLPSVLMEAMAAGVPPIAVDVGGVSEIIVDGATGYLVSVRTKEAIAEGVKRAMRDPDRAKIGRYARRWIAQNRSWKQTAGAYGRLYGVAGQSGLWPE